MSRVLCLLGSFLFWLGQLCVGRAVGLERALVPRVWCRTRKNRMNALARTTRFSLETLVTTGELVNAVLSIRNDFPMSTTANARVRFVP